MLRYGLSFPVALVLMLGLGTVTARGAGADDVGPVASFVNDSTLALMRIDLARADLKDFDHPAVPVEQVRKRLLEAGAKQAYLIPRSGATHDLPGLVIVPLENNTDEQKVTAALAEPFAAAPPAPGNRGRRQSDQYIVERVRDAVVLGRRGEVQALKSMTATPRADLAEALKSAGDAPLVGAVALAPTAAAMLQQTVPTLPPEMGGRRTADLIGAFRFASFGGDLVKNGATLKIHAADANGAQTLLPVVQNMLNAMARNPMADPAQPSPAPAQAKVQDSAIVTEFSPQQVKRFYDSTLSSALWIQSARHVRQIGQAIYVYFNAKKAWPPDLDTLVKGGYIDPSILINPRNPTKQPGYIYVKPVGKMQDIIGESVNLYENVGGDYAHGIVVGFQDGHAELMSPKEKARFEEMLKKSEAGNKARAAKPSAK